MAQLPSSPCQNISSTLPAASFAAPMLYFEAPIKQHPELASGIIQKSFISSPTRFLDYHIDSHAGTHFRIPLDLEQVPLLQTLKDLNQNLDPQDSLTKRILDKNQKVLESQPDSPDRFRERINHRVLETTGYFIGCEKFKLEELVAPQISDVASSLTQMSAEVFLQLIRQGNLNGRGSKPLWVEPYYDRFLYGAEQMFEGKSPKYLPKVASAFSALLSKVEKLGEGHALFDLNGAEKIGENCGRILSEENKAAQEIGLPKGSSQKNGHRVSPESYIFLSGWYLGQINSFKEQGLSKEAEILERNRGSVFHKALHSGNLKYIQDVLKVFQGPKSLVSQMNQAIAGLKEKGLGEEAEILEKNRASVFNKALNSGNLKYIEDVLKVFQRPKSLVSQMNQAIVDLKEQGLNEEAEILEKNRASVFNKALKSGNLKYIQDVLKVFQGPKNLVSQMNQAITGLKEKGLGEEAEILEKNRASVFNKALNSGNLKYIEDVLKVFQRPKSLVSQMNQAIVDLKEQGLNEEAEILARNRGSVFYKALVSGNLKYIQDVLKVFQGPRSLVSQMNQAIVDLKEQGLNEEAEILEKNKGSVFSRALVSGNLKYIEDVLKAFQGPKSLVSQMNQAIENLKGQGLNEEAEILTRNRGSVFSRALVSGNLKYIEDVYAHLQSPHSFVSIFNKAKEDLINRGKMKVAEALDLYKDSNFSIALLSRRLDHYIQEVIEATEQYHS